MGHAGVDINGATSATYTIAGVMPAHAGSYDVVAFVGLELRWQWLTVDPNGPVLGGSAFSSASILRVGEF